MKIREVLNREPYKFKDLKVGDMFYYEFTEDYGRDGRYNGKNLCIKILPIKSYLYGKEFEHHAFDLSENTLRPIGENNNIQLVDAEIVIKEIKKDYAIGEVEE